MLNTPSNEGRSGGRIRGVSFKQEYAKGSSNKSAFQRLKTKVTGRGRAPSMVAEPSKSMLPPQAKEDRGRLTVVLDLDETLIYAREGPLYARPGLEELLDVLAKRCEPVVWTAGVRAYAQAVIKNIDKKGVIKHCVYRHKKWFSGCAGYNKDLTLLGRDMDKLVILENTPDCVRGNEQHGIVVTDFEGEGEDQTLYSICELIEDMCDQMAKKAVTVPQYIESTNLLHLRGINTDVGDSLCVYCLDTEDFVERKAQRVNKDLKPNQL
ncbi:Phosphatase PSR1 [Diplonema papillatum]|nr:Phosphatase PSR1 [Diplonema papillatum]